MSIVKINALTIPPQAGDDVVGRFAARLDELSLVTGFEGFELLKPTGDNEKRWFVYSRWADEAAYEAWRGGHAFARDHGRDASTGEHPAEPDPAEPDPAEPDPAEPDAAEPDPADRPQDMMATLLEFQVVLAAEGATPSP